MKQKRLGQSTKGGAVQLLEQIQSSAAVPATVQQRLQQLFSAVAVPAPVSVQQAEGRGFTGNRLLVEYCCSEQSELGKWTRSSSGCSVLRLTEKEDMTNQESVTKAIGQIMSFNRKPNITLWASMPCTGGSTWQYVNEHMFLRNGNTKALNRLKGLRTLFRKLWVGFERIAQHVINMGGNVYIMA